MSGTFVTMPATPDLSQLDAAQLNRFQLKIMLTAGMGFFTDAYDLFVIGTAVLILKGQWHLTPTQISLLASTTLAASAVGAVVFGRVADLLGRRRIYGYEVLILAVGAIASALAPGIWWLIAFRSILGVGIGGDYPVSATIMSEYSGKAVRGRLVGLVFSMQAVGLVVGPLVAVILLASGVSHDLTWRLLLGLGALPGLAVFYLRRQIQETPRFAIATGALDEAELAIAQATGMAPPRARPGAGASARRRQAPLGGLRALVSNRVLLKWLIGGSLAWFVMDFAYYGNTIASPQIIRLISAHASILQSTLITLAIFVVAAVPGYVCAILFVDRIGRRTIQSVGFFMMFLTFGLIAAVPGVASDVGPFVVLFGASYFFTEYGPNTTTFIYPAEMFPVEVRTSGHGICAALGKLGAFAGTYLFTDMLAAWGVRGAEGVAAGVALLGLLITLSLLPETRGKSLEELSEEADHDEYGRRPLRAATAA